ncbi:MAG TPA: hypothetical protein DCZ55_14255 [Cyanobacteria bacterium UBA11371]|nr:hypothetical protein [Cyanobacteria bacterium UBA11371]HBE33784.1 hypothetical protein [Cyanobacteria bacterium UBA11368]
MSGCSGIASVGAGLCRGGLYQQLSGTMKYFVKPALTVGGKDCCYNPPLQHFKLYDNDIPGHDIIGNRIKRQMD